MNKDSPTKMPSMLAILSYPQSVNLSYHNSLTNSLSQSTDGFLVPLQVCSAPSISSFITIKT